ncbi:MAG: hypothetical protein ACLQU4_07170 [Limisphaerales bacterium]
MNNQEAKEILALYRPATADRTDPSFAEAMERAKGPSAWGNGQNKADPELGRWFQEHCASHLSIRGKFLDIPVPAGLKHQILSEVQVPAAKVIPFRPMVLLRAAAIVALCLGLAALFWRSHHREDDFSVYRSRMVRTAMQFYSMELQSEDLQAINTYLAGRKAPADYTLPEGMRKAQAAGCAVLRWQGQPVSMLCFRSGQPLPPGAQTDLWLFIVDGSSVRNGPAASGPVVAKVKKLMTASWTQGGKVYMLAAAGDEAFLRRFF